MEGGCGAAPAPVDPPLEPLEPLQLELPEPGGEQPGAALPALPAGKRPSTAAEDEAAGGGAEGKLFGKGPGGATSLLQIAIRNGIYQNQISGMTAPGSTNSLLGRRRPRHRRNRSLGAPPLGVTPAGATPAGATPACSPLSTLSLDRRTFLRQKQRSKQQLQGPDKSWVASDPRRGCIHVHDWLTPSYPRPVLCTLDTTAGRAPECDLLGRICDLIY